MSARTLRRATVVAVAFVIAAGQIAGAQSSDQQPAAPVPAPQPMAPVPLVSPPPSRPTVLSPVPPAVTAPAPLPPAATVPSPMAPPRLPSFVPPAQAPVPAPPPPTAPSPTEQRLRTFVPPPPPAPVAAVQGFSVVLVLGSAQSGAVSDDVPPAARRALEDMKDFLPYRSYRLLDAAWILGGGFGVNGEPVRSVLRGPEGQQYEVSLRRQGTAPGVAVTFGLREVGGAPIVSRSGDTLSPTHFLPHETGEIISTSFTMDVGETVVVGTSRIGGDTALIALLTAVPRGAR